MPRAARVRSETGLHHVMVRGINRQNLFIDDEDRFRYLERLDEAKGRSGCTAYAYCLMDNHIHLILGEGSETIGQMMKRLGSAYVFWYNRKYERVGHLFQDRFLSEPIQDEAYLLAALRYVHQNPVKAGIVSCCEEYRWSSYRAYVGCGGTFPRLVDTSTVLDRLGGSRRFADFHQVLGTDDLIDVHTADRLSDAEALRVLESVLGDRLRYLQQSENEERDRLLLKAKSVPGVSQRQLARLTGLPRSTIRRV